MVRPTLRVLPILAIAGAVACGADDDVPVPPGALETETGIAWNIVTDPTTGTISFAEPRTDGPRVLTAGRTATEAALVFLESHASSFALTAPRTDLVPEAEGTDALGLRYASFIVTDERGAVTPTRLALHFDDAGRILFVAGRHASKLAATSLDGKSVAAKAPRVAPASRCFHFDATGKGVHFYAAPPLHDDADVKRFTVVAGAGGPAAGYAMARDAVPDAAALSCVDAATGAVISATLLDTWDATGPDAGAAVDAYYFAGKALEFYRSALGRASYDDANGPLLMMVHDSEGSASYSDGAITLAVPPTDRPSPRLSFAGAFDVIAHELQHGVTASTLRLADSDDDSANAAILNEAISDVFAAFAEHWLRPGDANLTVGEDVAAPGYPPTRDLLHPGRCLDVGCTDDCGHRACPDHLSRLDPAADVHRGTGIAANAWALMTVGGANDTSRIRVDTPLGWDASLKLWYALVVSRAVPPNARFEDVALATIALARHDPAVVCGWVAVGVIDAARAASFWNVRCAGP